jgi:hypothetical protein
MVLFMDDITMCWEIFMDDITMCWEILNCEKTNVKHNSFIKSEGYMFRPQTVIIRPYNNLSQLVLCT